MGRKRLLTLLAAMSVTVALQAAPAAAQISLGPVDLGTDDCLQLGVDVGIDGLVGLDADVCVLDEDGDPIDVDGELKVGDQKLDLKQATEPVTDPVNSAVGSVKEATGGGDDGDAPDGDASPPPRRAPSSDRGGSGADDVVIAGSARDFGSQQRADQPALLSQLRDDLAFQRRSDVLFGPVAPGVGDPGIAAPPEVADGLAPGVAPAEPAPQVTAPTPERQDAVLATEPFSGGAQVPAALQLLTGAMVLGAATVWYLARREYGGPAPTAI